MGLTRRILHRQQQNTAFFQVFIKTYYILGHKTYLKKLRHIKIIQIMSSDHKEIKLELSKINQIGKSLTPWKLIQKEVFKEIFKHT